MIAVTATEAPTRLELLDRAREWHDSGFTVLPIVPTGEKRPIGAWKRWQSERPTWGQTEAMISTADTDGICVLTGGPTHLEMIEFEGRATDLISELGELMASHAMGDLWASIAAGYVEMTPSGGVHLFYRVTDASARENARLASRPATDAELAANPEATRFVLIETRGEGGLSVVAPSGGRSHPSGKPWVTLAGSPGSIPAITGHERDALHAVASMLDRMPISDRDPEDRPTARPRQPGDPLRPGDDFNERATWDDILIPHGWTRGRPMGHGLTWTRPGKSPREGISATTGQAEDADRLWVFSTSTEFDTGRPYDKFAAWALLNGYGADLSSAASALSRLGFGQQSDDPFATLGAPMPPSAVPAGVDPMTGEVLADDAIPLWDERAIFRYVHDFALARMVSPEAALGVVLLRLADLIPPHVKLPAIVGGRAGLNLFLALVGPSGAGKGATMAAVDEMFPWPRELDRRPLGSGEGIAHSFAQPEKQGKATTMVPIPGKAVMFELPEVDSLTAMINRNGATLDATLRAAWSGETLGAQNAEASRRVRIPAHSYRMTFVLGVQPERAAALFAGEGGGTPQRFLWLSATSGEITLDPLDEPPPYPLRLPGFLPESMPGPSTLVVHREIVQAVREFRYRQARGEIDSLDAHSALMRLKIAAVLGVLDGRLDVSPDDWRLAGRIMRLSDATRYAAGHAARARADRDAEAAGRRDGLRQAAAEAEHLTQIEARTRDRLIGILQAEPPEGIARSDLRRRLSVPQRPYFDAVIGKLAVDGWITATDHRVAWNRGAA